MYKVTSPVNQARTTDAYPQHNLMKACLEHDLLKVKQEVEQMKRCGVEPSESDEYGNTPLDLAFAVGESAVCKVLFEAGVRL